MAYSLFSHLSEDAHLKWLNEFHRIIKPNGLIFLTIRQKKFLENIEDMIIYDDPVYNYARKLKNTFINDEIKIQYDEGYYIFVPTDSGIGLTNDFYGDSVIPDKYIYRVWSEYFDIVEHYDDPQKLPHAFICLRKRKK